MPKLRNANVSTEQFGTNEDHSKNTDYCCFCYDEGQFTHEFTMEEMIEPIVRSL